MTLGETTTGVFSTRYDPEDRYLACGYGDGATRIYNLETGKLSFTLSGAHVLNTVHDEMPVTGIRWRPQTASLKTQNVLVTTQADGSLKHWHATSGKCLHARCDDPENHLFCLDYNTDGTLLATGGKDTVVRVYDEVTKSIKLSVKGSTGSHVGHSNRIFSVKFNPYNENMVVSGGWDSVL